MRATLFSKEADRKVTKVCSYCADCENGPALSTRDILMLKKKIKFHKLKHFKLHLFLVENKVLLFSPNFDFNY